MKLGLISDIHAYLSHLQQAIELFEHNGVEHILCAGDLIDGGKDGDAVVSFLRKRQILCVQGNHDSQVFADQAWIRRAMRTTGETTHPFLLSSETVAYVSSLPIKLESVFSDISFCLAHGTPYSNTTYLFPDADEQRFKEVADSTSAQIIVLGHTHVPMCVNVGKKWILNPGSVYHNRFDATRTCAVLQLPDLAFKVFDLSTKSQIPLNIRTINTE